MLCSKVCQIVVCGFHHNVVLRTSLKDGELCHVNSIPKLILLADWHFFIELGCKPMQTVYANQWTQFIFSDM